MLPHRYKIMMKNQQCYLLVIRDFHGFYAWSQKCTILDKVTLTISECTHFKGKYDRSFFEPNLSHLTGCYINATCYIKP